MSADPWFQSLFADRIGGANYGKGTEIYKFEKIKRAKRKAAGRPPRAASCSTSASARTTTWPTRSSRDVAKREVDKLENRGYADNGIAAFKEAAAGFMQQAVRRRRSTRPPRSTTASAPSRPWPCCRPCFINPGDVTLMTVPGYPVAGTHTQVLRRRGLQAAAAARRTASIPTSTASPPTSRKRAKLLVINYPNSPTGAVATRDFYQQVIDFARTQPDRRRAGRRPHPAQLRRPAAQLPAGGRGEGSRRRDPLDVEGLQHDRLADGFVCGHPKIVQAFADVKDNCDSGQFMAIQQAARGGAASTRRSAIAIREKYRRRLQKLVAALKQGRLPGEDAGRHLFPLRAGARRAAASRTFANAEEASQFLIHEQIGLLRAVGRRRRVPALLRDLPRQGRSGRRRPDGRDGRSVEGDGAQVRVSAEFVGTSPFRRSASSTA